MLIPRKWLPAALSVAFCSCCAIPAAHATFPGRNGKIAFVFGSDIFTMNPDGSDVQQLTHMISDNTASWESWSADGRRIVFCEFLAPDFNGQLWVMDADGRNPHLLLAEPGFSELRPSFSPDGNTVIFSRGNTVDGNPDLPLIVQLYTVNADGTGLTQITSHTTPGVHDYGARFSPDGRAIYFQADQAGGIVDAIYMTDAAAVESPREITPPDIGARRPDISPEGRSVAFQTHCCNPQNATIAVINTRGTEMRELTHNGNDLNNGPQDQNPSFSPDGKWIVFERQAPAFSSSAIWVIRTDTGEMRQLITMPASRISLVNGRRGRIDPNRRSNRSVRAKEIEAGGSLPRWGAMPN